VSTPPTLPIAPGAVGRWRGRARHAGGRDAAEAIAADLVAARSLIEEVGAFAWSPFVDREQAWLAGRGHD